jgi:hypothetical protein
MRKQETARLIWSNEIKNQIAPPKSTLEAKRNINSNNLPWRSENGGSKIANDVGG